MKLILFALIVVSGTVGELFVSRAMKEIGEVHDFRPTSLLRFIGSTLRIPWMWMGVGMMALAFFALLAILSVENVWNTRLLMDVAPNTMAAEIANDLETALLRSPLDRAADVAQGRARPCLRHAIL